MFSKILIPIDLENELFAEKAMAVAIQQATDSNAALHVVTVIPGFGMSMVGSFFPEDAMQKALTAVTKKLKQYVDKHVPKTIKVSAKVLQGKAHKEILKESKNVEADLIVIPSHNVTRVDKVLLGSTTSRVVERAKVSVMVIKP
jgi:nucleotide-binding universal stress UspA family protein